MPRNSSPSACAHPDRCATSNRDQDRTQVWRPRSRARTPGARSARRGGPVFESRSIGVWVTSSGSGELPFPLPDGVARRGVAAGHGDHPPWSPWPRRFKAATHVAGSTRRIEEATHMAGVGTFTDGPRSDEAPARYSGAKTAAQARWAGAVLGRRVLGRERCSGANGARARTVLRRGGGGARRPRPCRRRGPWSPSSLPR